MTVTCVIWKLNIAGIEEWDGYLHSMDLRGLGVHHMLWVDALCINLVGFRCNTGKGKMEGSIWGSLYFLY
jgi:hypothetical protein